LKRQRALRLRRVFGAVGCDAGAVAGPHVPSPIVFANALRWFA